MITMMKIMRKIKIITIKTLLKENNNNNKKKTNTITTNKTLIYNRQNTYRGREKKKTYLLHPNYEKTTLSNMQRKHHVH